MYIYTLKITFKTTKSYNSLKQNLNFLKKTGKFKNIKINNFFKVKNKNKIFTILKSPHVFKKSREHFIYKNYIFKSFIKTNNIFILLNFIIILKYILNENKIINLKISKMLIT